VVPKVVGSNPIFHPSKKSVPSGADLFFPALKVCFYKQEKTEPLLPQAKRTFLMKLTNGDRHLNGVKMALPISTPDLCKLLIINILKIQIYVQHQNLA